jgi:hypothetical protein
LLIFLLIFKHLAAAANTIAAWHQTAAKNLRLYINLQQQEKVLTQKCRPGTPEYLTPLWQLAKVCAIKMVTVSRTFQNVRYLFQIFGWLPETYNSTKLPADMPKSLTDYIKTADKDMADRMVWFSCEGENPADRENLGAIDWYPYPGVPDYFFPYRNQAGYLSPGVFAHLKNPKRKSLKKIISGYSKELITCSS